MEAKNAVNRQTMFALLSALAAGIVSYVLVIFFIEMLHWLFVPSVMIMVFISAYYAFRGQTRGNKDLTFKRIFWIAFEVGTRTHFYTFALYIPLYFFAFEFDGFSAEIFGMWIGMTLFMGLVSLVMFIWIAISMYIGVGYIQKSFEKVLDFDQHTIDDSILDDDSTQSEIKPSSRLKLD